MKFVSNIASASVHIEHSNEWNTNEVGYILARNVYFFLLRIWVLYLQWFRPAIMAWGAKLNEIYDTIIKMSWAENEEEEDEEKDELAKVRFIHFPLWCISMHGASKCTRFIIQYYGFRLEILKLCADFRSDKMRNVFIQLQFMRLFSCKIRVENYAVFHFKSYV